MKPYVGNPNLKRQAKKIRQAGEARDINTLPDPRTRAFVGGLLGDAPDEQGWSVLHPARGEIKEAAAKGYALGLLGSVAPGKALGGAGLSIKSVGTRTEAMEKARRNAVEMLGLPEGNTALDRAKALGFYDGWYHGSPNPAIGAFDPTRAGQRGVDYGPATFASKNPDSASGYSLNWQEYANHPAKQEIEAKRQSILSRFLEARAAGKTDEAASIRGELQKLRDGDELYEDFLNYQLPSTGSTVYPLMIRADDMPWVDGRRQNFNQVNGPAIEQARAQGAPGVRINDVADNAGRFNGTSDVMAVFEPSRLRSRFAAFDPARVNESDILGRADPRLLSLLGIGAGGAAYLLDDEE